MKKSLLYIGIALTLAGCNFLDKDPDLRADINTKNKVQLLLASGYDMPNWGVVGEVMSDNVIDNNTDPANKKVPMSTMYDDYFAWRPVEGYSQQDSPYAIWSRCYKNIAVANQALAAIEKLEKADSNIDLSAEKAEAKLIRAYNHFVLVNIFCQAYKNDDLSSQNQGVHYMIEAETQVRPKYERGTVTEVYQHIQQDINEALPYVSDSYYSVPKYHFNTKAAYAFAAKFYLFKRDYAKVIEYANKVLGTTEADARAMMFNAANAKSKGNAELESLAWIEASDNSNLLIVTTMSPQDRMFSPSYGRYTTNGSANTVTIGTGGGPCWSGNFPGATAWRYDQKFGSFFAKIIEHFEYTDKVAGIGYVHTMRREFTANECLLTRAEAKIQLGDLAGGLNDMNIWCQSYDAGSGAMKELTVDRLKTFVNGRRRYPSDNPACADFHTEEMGWGAQAVQNNSEKEQYLQCCLHLRRVESMFDGNRLWDIKRYGIEIKHQFGYPTTEDVLKWDDHRRAVQIPQDAILGGQEPNPGYSNAAAGSTDEQMSASFLLPFNNIGDNTLTKAN